MHRPSLQNELGLEDAAFLVTGAAGGIGSAVAAAFEDVGARVALLDRDAAAVEAVRAEMRDPARHRAVALELSEIGRHRDLVAEARSAFGRLDGLVHLAAVLRRRQSIDEITEEDWDLQNDVNLKATFFLNREVARSLRADGGGSIVNFVSQGWLTGGLTGSLVYAATKGGIVSLSRGLARSLAPDGIRVNTVAPGAVDTPMMRDGATEEQLGSFVEAIPIGRMAEPDEVARAAVFLSSDWARYITGATLNVSGGQIMY